MKAVAFIVLQHRIYFDELKRKEKRLTVFTRISTAYSSAALNRGRRLFE